MREGCGQMDVMEQCVQNGHIQNANWNSPAVANWHPPATLTEVFPCFFFSQV